MLFFKKIVLEKITLIISIFYFIYVYIIYIVLLRIYVIYIINRYKKDVDVNL